MRREWALLLAAILAICFGSFAYAQEADDFMDDDDEDFAFDDEPDFGNMMGGGDGDFQFPDEPAADSAPTEELPPVPYVKPSLDGLTYLETFDGDWSSRWLESTNTGVFNGEWSRALRKKEALTGDFGLRVENEARRHAIASRMPRVEVGDEEFVFSYEVKFEFELQCGGAYVKLFDSSAMDSVAKFDNETPYVVMFGPDRCGSTNKVHFIVRHFNPISKEWEEKHMVPVVRVPRDTNSHVYTLRILPDDTFEIYVDEKLEKKGSLKEDMSPAFTNAEEIDDPTDTQPEDWVTLEKIPDPEAVKPEDWDEDAPMMIPDPDDSKPEDWLEDEMKVVPDPDATQPEEWDEDEDGAWSPPVIPNPRCVGVSGCGEWKAKTKRNPEYKGKWKPPIIDNPEYKGPFVPRQIPNPAYYVEEHPHRLPAFDAIGIELWTMNRHILFDNIATARSFPPVQRMIGETWKLRSSIEASRSPKKTEAQAPTKATLQERALGVVMQLTDRFGAGAYVGAGGVALLIVVALRRLCRRRASPVAAAKKGEEATASAPSGSESSEAPKEEAQAKEGVPRARKRQPKPTPAD